MAVIAQSKFLRWFYRELSGLCPVWFKMLYLGQPKVFSLVLDADVKALERSSGKIFAPVSILGSKEDIPKLRNAVNVDISLPKEHFLRRKINFPRSTLRALEDAARLDLLRRTPFKRDEVFWVLGRPNVSDTDVEVDQWVVKRSTARQWQLRFSNHNLKLRRVYVEDAGEAGAVVDFSHELGKSFSIWRKLNGVLALTILGLAVGLWVYPGIQAAQETARLEEALEPLRAEAITLRRELEKQKSLEVQQAKLWEFVYHRPLAIGTLQALTVSLQDDVWVSELNLQGGQVVLKGQTSGSAADLVLNLSETSSILQNPRLNGSVSKTSDGAERFELALDLRVGDE